MKTETKVTHTPGPWSWRREIISKRGRQIGRIAIQSASGHYITTDISASTHDLNEHEANAVLIAAAPELLEAAEKALDAFAQILCKDAGNPKWHNEDIKKLVAAIAKAKGGAA